jgi:hypothetical protein
MKPIRPKHYIVSQYAMQYYVTNQCTLCGNSGIIDTRGVRTAAGVPVGRLNWCVCPNGQALRQHRDRNPTDTDLRR